MIPLGLHWDSTGIHLDSEQSDRSPIGQVGDCKVQGESEAVYLMRPSYLQTNHHHLEGCLVWQSYTKLDGQVTRFKYLCFTEVGTISYYK